MLGGEVLGAAAGLIGCRIVHGPVELVIVETEAYHQSEPACHGYGGHTSRADRLRRPAGHAYVHLTYGIHYLVNVVAGSQEFASGVLLRGAVRQTPGAQRVPLVPGREGAVPGPGRIGTALRMTKEHDGADLLAGGDFALLPALEEDRVAGLTIARGPRIGISKATELPWRFCLSGSEGVSRPRI